MIVAVDRSFDDDEAPVRPWTKSLRPMTLACLGCLLLGAAVAASAWLTTSDPRTLRAFFIWFTIGATLGAFLFVPMAVLLRFRRTLARRLRPHVFRIQWSVSIAGALGMGYLLASMRHATADWIMLPAGFLVFLCAWTKVGLSVIYGNRLQGDPSSRGRGWRS